MDDKENVVEYRLTNIERTLVELKDVMTETKLQASEIKSLGDRQIELLNAVNAHDKRLRVLEVAPAEKKAGKWDMIIDLVFKALLAAGLGIVMAKVGLQ